MSSPGIIVVCRLNSGRLSYKALRRIESMTMIEHCLFNASRSKCGKVVLATSTLESDDDLMECERYFPVFRGDPDDVASRIFNAANHFSFDPIVRVTGDSPLISPELIDYMLEDHINKHAEYSYLSGASLGTFGDVFSLNALSRLINLFATDKCSEYLSLIFKNSNEFRKNEVQCPEEYASSYRLNVDYLEDEQVVGEIIRACPNKELSTILEFLRSHPKVVTNSHIKPRYIDPDFIESVLKHRRSVES